MKVFNREKVKAMGYTDAQINAYLERVGNKPPEARTESATAPTRTPTSDSSSPYRITQTFGQRSKYDSFSGGVNYGVDFATPRGTPVVLPEGNWKVEQTYAGATRQGFWGNKDNSGYGNSVVVKNEDTGEKVRVSHLDKVAVQPGETITGGVVGLSGWTGNATGPHLDAEYYNSKGQKADILKTPYKDLFRSTVPNKPKRSGSQSLLGY